MIDEIDIRYAVNRDGSKKTCEMEFLLFNVMLT